jgi:O-methyltransferase
MLNFLRRKNKKKSHQVSREFADLSEVEKNIIRICKPYTMTGKLRLLTLIRGIEYLTKSGIEGDIIECGVWKGGSMMAAGMMLNELQDIRNLYLYDTFQGMTEPKDIDISVDKISGDSLYKELPDWCKANIDEVKEYHLYLEK